MPNEHEAQRPDPDVDPYGARLWDLEEELRQQRGVAPRIKQEWAQIRQYHTKVAIAGLIVIILMSAFPPWTYTFRYGSTYSEVPAGYSFIAAPPEPRARSSAHGVKLDITRLLVQCLIVLVAIGLGMILLSKRSS